MVTATDFASRAYESWRSGHPDSVAALFANALLAIPGRTKISGDHKGQADVSAVLAQLGAARASGKHRQGAVCSYTSSTGAIFVFDNFVTRDGRTEQYHSIHEWIMRDGKLIAVMVYVHEYEVFERAWL